MNVALIVFAGSGTRIHSVVPKQFVKIGNKEMVVYTIEKFNKHPLIDEIVLVTSKEYLNVVKEFKDKYHLDKITKVVEGGASRQESVRLGLESLGCDENDNVLIHDGDRPLVSEEVIDNTVEYLKVYKAACPFIYQSSELPEVSNSGRKVALGDKPIDIQTPQAFKYGLILSKHIEHKNEAVLDDVSLVEKDVEVQYFEGENINFKVTEDKDLEYLEKLLQ